MLLGDTNALNHSKVLSTIESNAPALNPVIALRKITRKRPELFAFWQARTKWELSDGNTWESDECATNLMSLALDGRALVGMDASQHRELAAHMELAGHRAFAAQLRKGPAQAADANLTDYRYVDLTDHQNAERSIAWHNLKDEGNTLQSLHRGWLQTQQAPFVVSEVIQVLGSGLAAFQPDYPERIPGIRIRHSVQRLHFLQGTGWAERDGVVIGRYRVRYTDGETMEIPIRYGMDVRNWQFWPDGIAQEVGGPAPAWKGPQDRWRDLFPAWGVRLYVQTWLNPHPERPVESVDFESTISGSAPFLVGVTAEIPPRHQ